MCSFQFCLRFGRHAWTYSLKPMSPSITGGNFDLRIVLLLISFCVTFMKIYIEKITCIKHAWLNEFSKLSTPVSPWITPHGPLALLPPQINHYTNANTMDFFFFFFLPGSELNVNGNTYCLASSTQYYVYKLYSYCRMHQWFILFSSLCISL